MTPEEYEDQYQGALRALCKSGATVGLPYRSRDGVRAVRVDDLPCTDEVVFEKAWGRFGTAIYAEALDGGALGRKIREWYFPS